MEAITVVTFKRRGGRHLVMYHSHEIGYIEKGQDHLTPWVLVVSTPSTSLRHTFRRFEDAKQECFRNAGDWFLPVRSGP
jgi:hypothetical protein